jgi:hypothetical protein
MAKYKVMKMYVIKATSKTEAREKFVLAVKQGTEEELLEFISVKLDDKPKGFLAQVKE